jgi:hypothetical protein
VTANVSSFYCPKKVLSHTVDENCMVVEFEIGLGTTPEPKKEISVVAN